LGHRVLIVDDDAGVQKMLKIVLECDHFEVVTANDGLEALQRLDQARPDLILLDLTMPHMDGQMFVMELEQRGLRSYFPIIILTADIYAKPLVESMQVEGWIIKPFHIVDLLEQVRKLLRE
jgi:DNA-binding response OmpR family regulator